MRSEEQDSNAARYYRLTEDNSIDAGLRFQRLVEACERDGYISRGEASLLVQEHNRMQEESRQHLIKLLKKHGQTSQGHGNVTEGIQNKYTPWVDGGVRQREPERYAAWDHEAYVDRMLTPKPGLFESYMDMVEIVISPGKKTRFFMIIGCAILLILLARYYGFH